MNCLTAQQVVDQFHSHRFSADGEELPGPTKDEAARHVKGCPACQTAVRRRQQIDARIVQLSRDVPVPVGLRERLLARLEAAGRPSVVNQTTAPDRAAAGGSQGNDSVSANEGKTKIPVVVSPASAMESWSCTALRSRRRMMASAVAACVLLLSGGVAWRMLLSRPALLSMDEIAGYALSAGVNPVVLPELAQFKGGLELQLPATMRMPPLEPPIRRLVDPQLGDREIAVYFFTLQRRAGVKIEGRLVIVPAAAVKDVPAVSSFPGPPIYKLGFCTTAWAEGKFVYLCCVRGNEGELQLLRPTRAAPA